LAKGDPLRVRLTIRAGKQQVLRTVDLGAGGSR
jgi:hypothetical protein